MANIQQLIQKIVSDPKIAASRNFADKVYRDEPILITAPQMRNYTPPKIREMRKLAARGGTDARVFYEQAKFMESYEDDLPYLPEVVQYFPTYQAMTDVQLRGYFSWRTRARKGIVEKTSLSFAFMYIYELLNGVGVQSPEQGFHVLKDFWRSYREFDSRVNSYAALWLKDYVIYHNLDKSLLQGLSGIDVDNAVVVLLDYKSRTREEVFSALNSLSSYDLEESRFFKEHSGDVRNVVCRVFSVISEYYNRNPKQSASEKLFGRVCTTPYSMFKSAVFHHRVSREDRVYEIGDSHRYICERGDWFCERFVWYGHNNKRIGAILKTVDYLMRQRSGFKSTLQPGKTNKILTGKIEKEIAGYEREKRENTPPKIDIDVSKLHGIRASALVTQYRLLVEEPAAEEFAPAVVETTQEAAAPECGAELDDAERGFLHCLLDGGGYEEFARSRGMMASILVDRINEKLFDLFSDTVIVDEGNGPELIVDYREELKGMFPR